MCALLVLLRMGALSLQHTHSVFVAMIVQWPHSHLPEELTDSKSTPFWLLSLLPDILHPSNSHSLPFSWPKTNGSQQIIHISMSSISPTHNRRPLHDTSYYVTKHHHCLGTRPHQSMLDHLLPHMSMDIGLLKNAKIFNYKQTFLNYSSSIPQCM